MQCEYVTEVYGVLVFPLVALTRRVVATRLCGGTVTTANVITPTNEVILTFVLEAGDRRNHK